MVLSAILPGHTAACQRCSAAPGNAFTPLRRPPRPLAAGARGVAALCGRFFGRWRCARAPGTDQTLWSCRCCGLLPEPNQARVSTHAHDRPIPTTADIRPRWYPRPLPHPASTVMRPDTCAPPTFDKRAVASLRHAGLFGARDLATQWALQTSTQRSFIVCFQAFPNLTCARAHRLRPHRCPELLPSKPFTKWGILRRRCMFA